MPTEKPLISIIIPTFNRSDVIFDTLLSIANQTYSNWECIIVDDGSTDDSLEKLKVYSKKNFKFKVYTRPDNLIKGANSCRNFGLGKAGGSFVKWLDSDDLLMTNTLEEQLSSFSSNTDVVVCKLKKVDLITGAYLGENTILSETPIPDYLIGNISFYVSGPLWKKSFLRDKNLSFDSEITNLDDWDFNLRALYYSPKIQYINTCLVIYRIHKQSLSHEINKVNMVEVNSEIKARIKHLALLKNKDQSSYNVLLKFTVKRLKLLLIKVLVTKKEYGKKIMKILLSLQLRSYNFVGAVKTIIAYFGYKFFNKGYRLLK